MTKKQRKEKKKRLKSLILLLFLTIILLTTSTYAWFTSNRNVQIDPIDVHVAASEGLLISSDAANWKTTITNNDIVTGYTNHKNMLPADMVPVSTIGTNSNGYLQFFRGNVAEDETSHEMALTAVATPTEIQYVYTISNGERVYDTTISDANKPVFIAFDVFFRNDSTEDADVYLTNGSGVKYKTNDKGLQNAARYAFVYEGHGVSSTQASTAVGWTSGTGTVTIVEPNYDTHSANGVTAALNIYGQTTQQTGATALDYAGVKAAINTPITLTATGPSAATNSSTSSYFGTISNLVKTNNDYSLNNSARVSYTGSTQDTTLHKIFTLEPGITKYRIYMWVEGQDVDCENGASGVDLTYTLGFSLDSE